MKINKSIVLKNADGTDMTEKVIENEKAVDKNITVENILSTSFSAVLNNEVLTAEQKNKLFQMSVKLYASKEPDYTAQEITLILERVDKIYPSPIVYGRMNEILNGNVQEMPNSVTQNPIAPPAEGAKPA